MTLVPNGWEMDGTTMAGSICLPSWWVTFLGTSSLKKMVTTVDHGDFFCLEKSFWIGHRQSTCADVFLYAPRWFGGSGKLNFFNMFFEKDEKNPIFREGSLSSQKDHIFTSQAGRDGLTDQLVSGNSFPTSIYIYLQYTFNQQVGLPKGVQGICCRQVFLSQWQFD